MSLDPAPDDLDDFEVDVELDVDEPELGLDLGLFTVDELEAMCPGRVDPLDGAPADRDAGERSLFASSKLVVAPDDDGVLQPVPTQSVTVAAHFISAPERIVYIQRDDAFGRTELLLHGRWVDGEMCYVLEAGTPGLRRLVFLLAGDAPAAVAPLVGLGSAAEPDVPGVAESETVDVDLSAEGTDDTPLGLSLATPFHVVTLALADGDQALVEVAFVHGAGGAWILEWTGESTARVTSLDDASATATLARLLGSSTAEQTTITV